MKFSRKNQIFILVALSFGTAYSQSVVIDGGNIRVDAAPGAKTSVTTKSDKNAAGKKSRTEVITGDSDSTVVIDGKNTITMATGNGATAETNIGSQRTVVRSGSGTTVTNVGKTASVSSSGQNGKVFVNADFSGQDLSRANYAGASFTNVEAVGTNFRSVDLSRAVMTNVDLSKADLRGANLAGAQMTNVDWDGALLDGAIWVDGRRCGPSSVSRCK